MLTLMQTSKLSSHHLILIYGRKYWDKVINWRHMVRTGTINEREFKLLQFADDVDEAFNHIPVSYTHLDVYKRQISYASRKMKNLPPWFPRETWKRLTATFSWPRATAR